MNDRELLLVFTEAAVTCKEQIDKASAHLQDAMAGMIAEWEEMWERVKACVNDSFVDVLQALVDSLCGLSYGLQPKKKHPRPPRYAGPKNKGRLWTMAPQRVARSNCRRYRR